MSRRRRSHYRPSLGWILGVAFEGTLTRLGWPVQEFTCVRCCGSPRASSPHGLAAPASRVSRRATLRAVASGSRLLPTRPVKDFHLQSSAHAGHTSAAAPRSAAPVSDALYAINERGLDCAPISGKAIRCRLGRHAASEDPGLPPHLPGAPTPGRGRDRSPAVTGGGRCWPNGKPRPKPVNGPAGHADVTDLVASSGPICPQSFDVLGFFVVDMCEGVTRLCLRV
jgi:hypothetical protein